MPDKTSSAHCSVDGRSHYPLAAGSVVRRAGWICSARAKEGEYAFDLANHSCSVQISNTLLDIDNYKPYSGWKSGASVVQGGYQLRQVCLRAANLDARDKDKASGTLYSNLSVRHWICGRNIQPLLDY